MSQGKVYSTKPVYFIPAIAVSSGWLIFDQHILFLQRTGFCREPFSWVAPGGKLEPNESPLEAVIREIYEETNITLHPDNALLLTECYISNPNRNFTYHMFFYRLTEKPSISISKEHHDYRWVHLDEINSLPLMSGGAELLNIFKSNAQNMKLL